MTGKVVGKQRTKAGAYTRMFVESGGRLNHLVMAPSAAADGFEVGKSPSLPVRAAVETTSDGRATRNIVLWLVVPEGGAAA